MVCRESTWGAGVAAAGRVAMVGGAVSAGTVAGVGDVVVAEMVVWVEVFYIVAAVLVGGLV